MQLDYSTLKLTTAALLTATHPWIAQLYASGNISVIPLLSAAVLALAAAVWWSNRSRSGWLRTGAGLATMALAGLGIIGLVVVPVATPTVKVAQERAGIVLELLLHQAHDEPVVMRWANPRAQSGAVHIAWTDTSKASLGTNRMGSSPGATLAITLSAAEALSVDSTLTQASTGYLTLHPRPVVPQTEEQLLRTLHRLMADTIRFPERRRGLPPGVM